jgi:RNA polymerase sigma-70 factor, ECF subfamily
MRRRGERDVVGSHDVVVHRLLQAWRVRDGEALRAVLHPRASILIDSGGFPGSPTGTGDGAGEVARRLLLLSSAGSDLLLGVQSVNGRLGIVCREDSAVVAVVSLQARAARARRLWAVVDPDKLRAWNRGR